MNFTSDHFSLQTRNPHHFVELFGRLSPQNTLGKGCNMKQRARMLENLQGYHFFRGPI